MSTPVKTALASFGMSGKVFHAPLLLANDNYEVVSVVQRSSATANAFLPGVKIVGSFNDLLKDESIDLIIVNTPDMFHHEHAREALQAGKHVVVEKPFVQNSRDGEELVSLAKDKNLVLSVFHNRRWDNSFLTVQKIAREAIIGRVVEYEARYDRYRREVAASWKEEPGLGVGILQNLGSHLIDQAILLFGFPGAVFCNLGKVRSGSKVSDYMDLKLYYHGLFVSLKASYLARHPGPSYTLHGENGTFVKHGLDPQEEALKRGLSPLSEGWGTDPVSLQGYLDTNFKGTRFQGKIETIPGNYMLFYNALHSAIKHGTNPAVTAMEALDVVRVIEAAVESDSTKKVISFE